MASLSSLRGNGASDGGGLAGLEFLDACCSVALGEEAGGPTFKYQGDEDAPVRQAEDWPIIENLLGAATASILQPVLPEHPLRDRDGPPKEDEIPPAEMTRQYSHGSSAADSNQVTEDVQTHAREQAKRRMQNAERLGDLVEGGARYHGDWRGAARHGRGVYHRPDGSRYEGNFSAGYAHGPGTLISDDGGRYDGQWRMDQAHGQGKYTFADGSAYEGQWRDNEKCGKGAEFVHGTSYEGQFQSGQRHGQGLYMSSVTNVSYSGQFRHGLMDGEGKFQFEDGRLYFGQWARGDMDGVGTMDWPNGSRYEGGFFANTRHGEGMFIWSDGRVFKGQWCNGRQEGAGVITGKSGEKSRGEWADGHAVHTEPIIADKVPNAEGEDGVEAEEAGPGPRGGWR